MIFLFSVYYGTNLREVDPDPGISAKISSLHVHVYMRLLSVLVTVKISKKNFSGDIFINSPLINWDNLKLNLTAPIKSCQNNQLLVAACQMSNILAL